MTKLIDRTTLQTQLADGQPIRVLEALPPKYFNEGHLPGAKQLDYSNAVNHAKLLKLQPGNRVVVYCASDTCANSHQAADALTAAGFTNVAVYGGGKKDWERSWPRPRRRTRRRVNAELAWRTAATRASA